jgi:VWFA-related protein
MKSILTLAVMAMLPVFAVAQTGKPLPAEAPSGSPFKIKVSTELIVETVMVKDKEGKPVEGLSERDFVITEDGVPQTLSICEFQRLDNTPLPRIQPRSILNTDVAPISTAGQKQFSSGSPGKVKYENRRLLILYFDLMNLGREDQYRAFSAGRKYIQTQMAAPDLMSIMLFSKSVVRVLADFTDDREKLDQTIQTLIKEMDDDADSLDADTAASFGQNSSEFNLFNTDRQLAALQTTFRMLSTLNERKSLVYFSSSMNSEGTNNLAQLRATINAAVRANVQIYPVDSRGLVAFSPIGDATRSSQGGLGMFTGAAAMATLTSFQQSQDTLYALASNTGGKAMLDSNDLSQGIVHAQQAISSYYILGYYTTNATKDGKFRRIRIELADKQSAKLDYRQGYYAEKEFAKFNTAEKERQLEEALMLEDPITDLTIAMEINYFKLNSAEYYVPVAVKIPGSELLLARNTGSDRTLIDFIGEIRDDYGTVYSNLRDKISFKLKGETADALVRSPIEFDCGFTLLPGKYIIKVLARNAETGRIGTFQTTFTIPNLMKEQKRLPISSIVLSKQRVDMRQALYTAGKGKAKEQAVNPLVIDGLKLIPSVTRVFSKSRNMHVYFQAYEQGANATEPLVAYVTFFHGQSKSFETPAISITEGLNPKSKAVPVMFSVPLSKLPPGEYNCQVTILDPASKKAAFWQAPILLIQ